MTYACMYEQTCIYIYVYGCVDETVEKVKETDRNRHSKCRDEMTD